jgi:hypothetical protein
MACCYGSYSGVFFMRNIFVLFCFILVQVSCLAGGIGCKYGGSRLSHINFKASFLNFFLRLEDLALKGIVARI